MSRIDDADRQAQRVAERLALEKRQQEDRTKKRQEGESAFARLVQQGQSQTVQTRRSQDAQTLQQQDTAHADAESTVSDGVVGEAISASQDSDAREVRDRSTARQTGRSFNDKLKRSRAGEGERASESRLADTGRESLATAGRSSDRQTQASGAESRSTDARTQRESMDERGEALLGRGGQAGGARGGGALKTDADGGGKGGSGQNKDQQQSNLPAGFRFNPALMAPVPVAKPKDGPGSDRLRQLANEIAQKIVERVRVGTNAAGAAEFQIDLRSNVLAGLSIKVSGGRGKIKLVFSGQDREVLKLLGEQAEGLKKVLGGRGLTLDELRIEERA